MDLIQQFPEAHAFSIPGRSAAVLMIHGFTSTPAVFRRLAQDIHQHLGFEVSAPLLPGHGLTYKALDDCTFRTWLMFSTDQIETLSQTFQNIHLVGVSMGGALCAHVAMAKPESIRSVTLMAPAMDLKDRGSRIALSLLSHFPSSWFASWLKHKKRREHYARYAYDSYSVASALEFYKLCQFVRGEFQTDKPCLTFQPLSDKTIDPQSSSWYHHRTSNPDSKIIALRDSPHMILGGPNDEFIFSSIIEFLRQRS